MLTDCATQASLRQHHLFDRLPEPLFQEVCCLANHRRLEAGSAQASRLQGAEGLCRLRHQRGEGGRARGEVRPVFWPPL